MVLQGALAGRRSRIGLWVMSEGKPGVDVGIYTSEVTLSHKLEQLEDGKGREGTWNMGRLPKRLGKGETPDRLFFATDGYCPPWTSRRLLRHSMVLA